MARIKRREELSVTLPSLFRCPISMDVMKSPVSLCTGVTYDRSSIEKWLALGNNTCPATMQKLPSTHTTPNLTLRRLIQLWVAQAEIAQTPPSTISKQQAADVMTSEMDDVDSLARLIKSMKEQNLKFVASSDVAVLRFVEDLGKFDDQISKCEAIVEILDLIASESGIAEKLSELILKNRDGIKNCLSSLIMVLRKGNSESKVRTARILELIATNPISQRAIADKEGLVYELFNLFAAENDPSVVEAGLSALLTFSTSRTVRKELICLGVVKSIAKILSCYGHSTPPVRTIIEKALAILESIVTHTEGRNAIIVDDKCVIEIVKSLMKYSAAATEHGITVIWSVCCLSKDCTSIEKVVEANGFTKVLLVMQSGCSASTRQMCMELVKVFRAKTNRSSLANYETRTTHITPS